MNKKKVIKETKDCTVMAVADIELQYRKRPITTVPTKISDSHNVHKFFMDNYYDSSIMLVKEFFYILLLNRSNRITSVCKISEGGINGTVVDVRIIVSAVLLNLSSSVIAIHNHPSGNLLPSESDKLLTNKISKALTLIEVKLIDHLIITDDKYYSFADKGLI